jgi:hypothetical protein
LKNGHRSKTGTVKASAMNLFGTAN